MLILFAFFFSILSVSYVFYEKYKFDSEVNWLCEGKEKKRFSWKKNQKIFVLLGIIISYFISKVVFLTLFLIYIASIIFKKYQVRRKGIIFQKELIKTLESFLRLLKAGLPLQEALRIASSETKKPFSTEFQKIFQEMHFGKEIKQALHESRERYDLPSYHYFTNLLILHLEIGGSLNDVLEGLYHHLKTQEKINKKLRALSAEGRFSALILSLLTPFVFFGLWGLQPSFINEFLSHSLASSLLFISFIFWFTGVLIVIHLTTKKYV